MFDYRAFAIENARREFGIPDYTPPATMPKRCGDCAFTQGTDAHAKSGVLAELCVEGATPFFCHQRDHAGLLEPREVAGDHVLCRGYVDECTARGERPLWAVAVAQECIRIWEEATASGRDVPMEEIAKRVRAAGEHADYLGSLSDPRD